MIINKPETITSTIKRWFEQLLRVLNHKNHRNPIVSGGDRDVLVRVTPIEIFVCFKVNINTFLHKEIRNVHGVKGCYFPTSYNNDVFQQHNHYDFSVHVGAAFTINEVALSIKQHLEKLGYNVTIYGW